jgi:transcriptional regulator with XRE-family HTH domain
MNDCWIRRVRIKQGLKGFQLAEKLKVSAARVSVMEKAEQRGALTLKMMEKAAKALGCRFEYRFVKLTDLKTVKQPSEPAKPRYRVVSTEALLSESKNTAE